jgi:phosphoglycolate phosphatase-like HAD superfamily hydrolase
LFQGLLERKQEMLKQSLSWPKAGIQHDHHLKSIEKSGDSLNISGRSYKVNTRDDLIHFKPSRKHFIGIDSDGCVFDSMEPKHKECFCPVTIEKFGLAPISKYAREAWEFVNLYSQDRGCNRFHALQKTFDLLRSRSAVIRRGFHVSGLKDLEAWTKRETKLGNPALKEEIERTRSEELKRVYEWSLAINESVERVVVGVAPFPMVRECLERLHRSADVVVVSGTPAEALLREWEEHGIRKDADLIAGQEIGSKKEHLKFAAGGKYEPADCLMIGDAPGDLQAARANQLRFYPVAPGHEEESWNRFHAEVLDLFFKGGYTREMEDDLVRDFNSCLPEKPAWD